MPKSLFVDPSVVRAPGKVTFNDIPVNQYNKTIQEELDSGKFTTEGSTNKLLGICISSLNYLASSVVKFSRFWHSSFWKRAAGVPSTAR